MFLCKARYFSLLVSVVLYKPLVNKGYNHLLLNWRVQIVCLSCAECLCWHRVSAQSPQWDKVVRGEISLCYQLHSEEYSRILFVLESYFTSTRWNSAYPALFVNLLYLGVWWRSASLHIPIVPEDHCTEYELLHSKLLWQRSNMQNHLYMDKVILKTKQKMNKLF